VTARRGQFPVVVEREGRRTEVVGYRVVRPRGARALLVLAHGAGAGMDHPFLEQLSQSLGRNGVATFRYQFPYAEKGQRRPDARPLLLASVRAALAEARRRVRGLPLLAGGKSMGGRMTSLLASEEDLPGVAGLVFVGFPLHPAGQPGSERGRHLAKVGLPMLFLQGTRDALAEKKRMRALCRRLGGRAQLHEIAEADHGFHVPKRTGRSDAAVIEELASTISEFASDRSREHAADS